MDIKKLSELNCGFQSGFAFKSQDYTQDGIPIIKIGNIQNMRVSSSLSVNHFPAKLLTEKISQYLLSDGDVLIAMTGQGSVGRVGKVIQTNGSKCLMNQRVGKFLCDEINLNREYLYYILTTDLYQDFLFSTGTGSGQPNLSPEVILETEIPAPKFEEQKAIASVLSSLDNKIDLLHRQNKTLEAMAETLFRQWFIEEADESWENGCLNDIATFGNGKSRPSTVDGGAIPIYGGNGILGYTDQFNYHDKKVVIGRVGAYCGCIYYDTNEIWVSDNALIAKAKDITETSYLYFLLKYLKINEMAEGSSHPLITQTVLKSIPILFPPLLKIKEFCLIADCCLEKVDFNTKQISSLEKLRDTLLPKLMSGEVRVKVKDIKMEV